MAGIGQGVVNVKPEEAELFAKNPGDWKSLPWYLPTLTDENLSASAKQVLHEYSGIEEGKIGEHVQNLVCFIYLFSFYIGTV
jgi:hypothetical protein